jgi:hypothetical protein
MKLSLDKLLFPRLERDQRRRAWGQLLLTAFTVIFVGCAIGGTILWLNHRR